ncbi:serine--tRNA ligase [Lichenibacterium dinghuense]|uniref:serine--tRNA ligase n=1 Tax=Lichenibacterium dinghuense TaxID=2895977 RepID=UPI001F0256BD|nr:serine--tRNA ligase [Lichenibacterium sp. 6Y81]
MFDIKWIRDNPEAFDAGRRARGLEPLSAALLSLDDRRRSAIGRSQAVQERRNAAAKEIGQAMGRKDLDTAERLKAEVAGLKAEAPALEAEERDSARALEDALMEIPNIPREDVPLGADEHGNVEQHRAGQKPGFPDGFVPREHFALGEALGLMDFDAAARMSGARFVVLKGTLARLHRALGQYMIDMHVDRHGYEEVDPPVLVRDAAMYGTAQLPKFRDDQFRAGDDHWLIPTAEVPLTNLARERVIDERELPMRFTALTNCFRAEAGSAGRDTRGMIRQHQFAKVEMVSVTAPEASDEEHERMTRAAEDVLEGLGLHYRRMLLCTGDMGFASRKTFDLEVWLPGQGAFREISSCSTCGDFQARRMEARYRPAGAKNTRFVHTLNGSGVAVGRALVAVMENYQDPDGTIAVPEVLRPYMGGLDRIGPAKGRT